MKKVTSLMAVRTETPGFEAGGDAHPAAPTLGRAVARALRPRLARGLVFDLAAAVRAGMVRVVALHTLDGQPLPSDWAVPVLEGEVVVACAPLESPFSGVAALIVTMRALLPLRQPAPRRDDATRDRIARALVDVLLAELKPRPR
jgi:hypothetical protein